MWRHSGLICTRSDSMQNLFSCVIVKIVCFDWLLLPDVLVIMMSMTWGECKNYQEGQKWMSLFFLPLLLPQGTPQGSLLYPVSYSHHYKVRWQHFDQNLQSWDSQMKIGDCKHSKYNTKITRNNIIVPFQDFMKDAVYLAFWYCRATFNKY